MANVQFWIAVAECGAYIVNQDGPNEAIAELMESDTPYAVRVIEMNLEVATPAVVEATATVPADASKVVVTVS